MDAPIATNLVQSGLFFNAPSIRRAQPKGFIEGLRFPFVALRRGSRVYVWAHTPFGGSGRVVVEQTFNGGWRTVRVLTADRNGIAQASLRAKATGSFRAVLRPSGERSLPFSMHVPPDQFFNPFGQPTLLEPNGKACSH
jgi:hypothetical protein